MSNQIMFDRIITEYSMLFSGCSHDRTAENYVFRIDDTMVAEIEFSEFYPFESHSILDDFFRLPHINEEHFERQKVFQSRTHVFDFKSVSMELTNT
jgi:hypothetical protein